MRAVRGTGGACKGYMGWVSGLCAAALVMGAGAEPPPRPASFYGTVTVDGAPVAAGSVVAAQVEGVPAVEGEVVLAGGEAVFVVHAPADDPATPEVEGGAEGAVVRFSVGGAAAAETAVWHGGAPARVDLSVPAGNDLALTVEDGVTSATPSEQLTYTLTMVNQGPGGSTGVRLGVNLPPEAVFVVAGDGGAQAGSEVGWPAFELTAGDAAVRTLTVEVAPTVGAGVLELVMGASVADDGATGLDPVPADNAAVDRDTLEAAVDLSVAKDDGVEQARPGDLLTYTLEVANRGSRGASGVALTDRLPPEVIFLNASDGGAEAAGVVSWPVFALAAGDGAIRTVTVRVPEGLAPAVTELRNLAAVSDDGSGGADADPTDNSAADVDAVLRLPDLAVTAVDQAAVVTDRQSLAVEGEVAVTLANGGTLPAAAFEVAVFEDRDGDEGLGAGDVVLGRATLAGPLDPGETAILRVPVAGSVLFAGNRLWALADSAGAVEELAEANNLAHGATACRFVPPPQDFRPAVELAWPGPQVVEPASKDSVSTPLVVQLSDDDGDGRIGAGDVPDLVFVTSDLADFEVPVLLRAIRGDTGETLFDVAAPSPPGGLTVPAPGSLAAGDLDGDGVVEIITSVLELPATAGAPPVNRLFAFEHDGRFKWASPAYSTRPDGGPTSRDNPYLADLDRDGVPEIVVGGHAFNADGSLRWRGAAGQAFQANSNQVSPQSGAISVVADLDMEGDPEVVAGNTVYRSDGSIYWRVDLPDGYPAVANFDADPYPEIVVVAQGTVRLQDHDGGLLWGPVALPGTPPVAGGAPTVADFDADGAPEVGVAGSDFYLVYETDGTLKWQANTQDASSNMTGSTVFDLDGDGRFEVIYRDERRLRIYRGEDGVVLYEEVLSSNTHNEEPVVADVDGDGNAEIVVTSDRAPAVAGIPEAERTYGLQVLGDAGDHWVAARPVWNQHAYHLDNVSDGGAIPRQPPHPWRVHNTYRASAAPAGAAFTSPDLTASRLLVDLGAFPAVAASARIGNGGTAGVAPGLPVAFYDGDPAAGGTLLGTGATGRPLAPGEMEEVAAAWQAAAPVPGSVWVVADDDGTGAGRDSECDEANNVHTLAYDTAALGLVLGLDDGREAVSPGEEVTFTATVLNAYPFPATGVEVTHTLPPHTRFVAAGDGGSEAGGVVSWPAFDLPAGAAAVRTVTVEVDPAIPLTVATLTHSATAGDDGSHGPDPTPANNTASDTDRVLTLRADAGGPYAGDEGAALAFDASASFDRDGEIVLYEWDLDGDGAFDDAVGPAAQRAYDDDGDYRVSVRVTDDTGERAVAAAAVTVANVAPAPALGGERSATEGDLVSLAPAAFSDPGAADTHTAMVDWGDGTVEAAAVVPGAGGGTLTATHSYLEDGAYTVEVCVADDDGGRGCGAFQLTVANAAPSVAQDGDVDLRGWSAERYPFGSVVPDWQVAADGGSVTQVPNAGASIFYGPLGAVGTVVEGRIRVDTTRDDDYIGLVLGFRPGDTTNPQADFLLLDWKKGTQSLAGNGCFPALGLRPGLALSRVEGVPSNPTIGAHLADPCEGGSVTELARGRTLGDVGWRPYTDYLLRVEATATQVRVFVDGELEIEVDHPLAGGLVGFYNHSQERVRYSAFTSLGIGGAEGEVAQVVGSFHDAGALDTHTASVDWGDGEVTPAAVEEAGGAGTLRAEHRYLDDSPQPLQLCVTDDDGATGCGTVAATIVNLPPAVEAGPDRLAYGEAVELEAAFTDPGVLDTHTANIDWGDGTVEAGEVMEVGGAGTVTGSHLYTADGAYPVEVCVADDDGARACDGFQLLQVEPVLDVGLSLEAGRSTVRPGQQLTFTLTVSNRGTLEPRGLTVVGALPPYLTFVAAGDGGTFDEAAGTVIWTLPALAYQEERTLELTVQAAPELPFGLAVTSSATVTDDGSLGPDAHPEDNAAESSVVLWDEVTPAVEAGPDRTLVEGGEVTLPPAVFEDPDAGESFTATVEWGDGVAETVPAVVGAGGGTVAASHLYLDDGVFPVTVCVRDSAGHTGCGGFTATVANAAPVVLDPAAADLRLWQAESYPSEGSFWGHQDPEWTVAADGASVFQTANTPASFFYGTFPAFGNKVEVTMRVEGTDNDFIGFALGFVPGITTDPGAEYWIVDWKAADQAGARRGLALIRVYGVPVTQELWEHRDLSAAGGGVEEVARGLRYSDVGWQRNTDYRFTFEHSPDRLRVWVDGELELDVAGAFHNGLFAFYNQSQDGVRYSSFRLGEVVAGEGEVARFGATFLDAGLLDAHTATVAWGDGAAEPATVEPGSGGGSLAAEHTYLDDGAYTVEACVTDGGGATDCGLFAARIANLPPVVEAGADAAGVVGEAVTLAAAFTDPGVEDTHAAAVDWGDGSGAPGVVTEAGGAGTVAASHVYAAAGAYPVEVCVTDDDGARGCDALTVAVAELPRDPELAAIKTAELAHDADADGLVSPGDRLGYRITVTNRGDGAATAVVLTDPLPEHTTLVAGSVTASQGAVLGEDPLRVALGELAPGAAATVSFQAELAAELPPAVEAVANQAVVESAELPPLASDDPSTPEPADATTTEVIRPPEIRVADATASEAAGEVAFAVELSRPTTRELAVAYATADGSARAGRDYEAAQGTLELAAGESRAEVVVALLDDALLEPEETFQLHLSTPEYGHLADGEGVATLVGDEACPGPNLVANPGAEELPTESRGEPIPGWTVVEGKGWHRLRSEPAPLAGVAAFAPGGGESAELVQDVDVSALAAAIASGEQRFAFEGWVRTGEEVPPDVARIVVEYRDATNTVVLDAFDSGEMASPLEWRRVEDARPAPAGTAWVRLRLLATRFTGPGIDAFFDALSLRALRAGTLSAGDVRLLEGDAGSRDALFPLRLACPLEGEVTAVYTTADGTARAGEDYLAAAGSLRIPEGETAAVIPVPVLGDGEDEPHETFELRLDGVEGAVALDPVAEGTILNDDFCPRSPGYWKNHREAWPASLLLVGGEELGEADLLVALRYGGPDAASRLARHLVAAKLNLERGSEPSILPTVEAADAFLATHPPASKPRGTEGDEANRLKDLLDTYNNTPCGGG